LRHVGTVAGYAFRGLQGLDVPNRSGEHYDISAVATGEVMVEPRALGAMDMERSQSIVCTQWR
jgi:hypothetical protein